MRGTCARAVAIGLTTLAFTEHVDPRPWARHVDGVPESYRGHLDGHGRFLARPLDIAAYFEEIDRCRAEFADLRILSGVELSGPHHHPHSVPDLLAAAGSSSDRIDRVIGSVHALPDLDTVAAGGEYVEVPDAYAQRGPVEVVLAYLDEITALASSDAGFEVLGHIDYPLRAWPADAGTHSLGRAGGAVPGSAARPRRLGSGPGGQHPTAVEPARRDLVA